MDSRFFCWFNGKKIEQASIHALDPELSRFDRAPAIELISNGHGGG
jgi:hypothetical protein